MNPRTVSDHAFRDVEPLRTSDSVGSAVKRLLDEGLPALPAVDDDGRLAGIFGEREFFKALFPAYVNQLRGSSFLRQSLDVALEKREACRHEPISEYLTTDHVDVGPDFSDVQVAEIFLHHRVLIVPVVDDGRVSGVLTRAGFFRSLAAAFADG